MARFEERLPELVKEYKRMEVDFQNRCEMMWEDMLGEFSAINGLTERQEELVRSLSLS